MQSLLTALFELGANDVPAETGAVGQWPCVQSQGQGQSPLDKKSPHLATLGSASDLGAVSEAAVEVLITFGAKFDASVRSELSTHQRLIAAALQQLSSRSRAARCLCCRACVTAC